MRIGKKSLMLKGPLAIAPTLLLMSIFACTGTAPPEKAEDARKLEIVYRMYADYKEKDFPQVKDLFPKEAMALFKAGRVVFVDTRSPAEMHVSMLPGAVARDDFLKNRGNYRDKTPIAYCTISYRSGVFARQEAEKGVTLHNLAGGILAWTLEGGDVFDGAAKVRRIHVYAKKWDYPPTGYESVSFGPLERLTR